MRPSRPGPLLAIALAAIGPVLALAQGGIKLPGETGSTQNEPVDIRYGRFERFEEDGVITYLLTGKAEIFKTTMTLSADSIVGWQHVDPSGAKAKLSFDEVYAEGHVRVIRGKEKITAERVYFDYRTDRGLVIEGELRTKKEERDGVVPVVVRAKRFRQLDSETMVAEDGSFSTCEFGEPDYAIQVKESTIMRDAKGDKVSLKHIVPMGGGFPVLYFPYYFMRLGQGSPLRAVHYSNSSRFGHAIRTKWGFDVTRYERDENGDVLRDANGLPKAKRFGTVTVDADWLQKRGFGFGPGLEYAWKNYEGFVDTYFIHDTAHGLQEFDRTILPFKHEDRFRGHLFHRHWLLDEKVRIDLEASYLTDRTFLQTYFEKEAKEGKEQETYLYARYLEDNVGAFMFNRLRVNDFQTQVEYWPQLGVRWIAEPPIQDHVYFTTFSEVSQAKVRPDDQLHLNDPTVFRADSLNDLSAPFDLGPVMLTPFVGGRVSAFSEGTGTRETIDRAIFSTGARAFFQANRVYDADWDLVGLHGLRHIFELEARYTGNLAMNEGPDDLIQVDQVEQADLFEEVYLEMRNRFQTHGAGGSDDVFEFLNLGVAVEFYPRKSRDTGYFQPQNYLPPMSWISVKSDDEGEFDEREYSNVELDWAFTPRSFFSLEGQLEFNTVSYQVMSLDTTARLHPWPNVNFFLTDHYIEQVTNSVTFGVNWHATEKWTLRATETYDFDKRVFTQHAIGVARDLHDFVFDMEGRYDREKDDLTLAFLFYPKAAPKLKMRAKAGDLYNPQEPPNPHNQSGGIPFK
ncbi:MAG: hypothetical protein AAB434_07965 [Planctomycetota bacterium]